jgi:transcriptional regulator with XRE-family HTH domain
MNLSNAIIKLRKKSELTQKQVSLKTKLSQSIISLIENGGGTVRNLQRYLKGMEWKLDNDEGFDGDIGSYFRNLRVNQGLSLTNLEEIVDVSRKTLWRFETTGEGHQKTLQKIIDALESTLTVRKFSWNVDEYYTPKWMMERIHRVTPIDLDPAAAPDLSLTHVNAKRSYQKADDGLLKPWDAFTIFLNAPYGRRGKPKTGIWTDYAIKQVTEGDEKIIMMLTPASAPSASYFQKLLRVADMLYLPERVAFEVPGQIPRQAPFSSVIAFIHSRTARTNDLVKRIRKQFPDAGFVIPS